MRFTIPVAALILGAAAMPTENIASPGTVTALVPAKSASSSEHAKRDTITVELWKDSNRQGEMQLQNVATDVCYDFVNGWNDVLSSTGVQLHYGCTYYKDYDCPDGEQTLYYRPTAPGQFLNFNSDWNDQISSLRCRSDF